MLIDRKIHKPGYFLTVNGTENWVLSHIIFNRPPPDGFFSIAMVNWSTGLSRASFFRSMRATSRDSSYISFELPRLAPHCPICLLITSLAEPSSFGRVHSL